VLFVCSVVKWVSILMKKHLPAIIFTCLFLAGLLTFNRYGESWDDLSLQKYAAKSLNAYTTFPQEGIINIGREDLGFYGPFFVMLTDVLSNSLSAVLLFSLPDLRHLVYYLTYFAGVLAFHSIAKRWLTQLPALGATLLFAAQPVFGDMPSSTPKTPHFFPFFFFPFLLGCEPSTPSSWILPPSLPHAPSGHSRF
jgi:hypothetical protein